VQPSGGSHYAQSPRPVGDRPFAPCVEQPFGCPAAPSTARTLAIAPHTDWLQMIDIELVLPAGLVDRDRAVSDHLVPLRGNAMRAAWVRQITALSTAPAS